jgi:hypothetical protein
VFHEKGGSIDDDEIDWCPIFLHGKPVQNALFKISADSKFIAILY